MYENSVEEFKAFARQTVPVLLKAGWSIDPEGPAIPNPFSPTLPPIRLKYRNPNDGLYYGLRNAARIELGGEPSGPGISKLTERQKAAVQRALFDPERAEEVVLSCPEFQEEGDLSGHTLAVQHYIKNLRNNVNLY